MTWFMCSEDRMLHWEATLDFLHQSVWPPGTQWFISMGFEGCGAIPSFLPHGDQERGKGWTTRGKLANRNSPVTSSLSCDMFRIWKSSPLFLWQERTIQTENQWLFLDLSRNLGLRANYYPEIWRNGGIQRDTAKMYLISQEQKLLKP